MAEIKAGDLDLEALESGDQWICNYRRLIESTDIGEIVEILSNATQEEWEYYCKVAFKRTFCSAKAVVGATERSMGGIMAGISGVAGGAAASILGASTVTSTAGGIFGFFAATTTAVVAAPAALVAGAAVGAAALGYGAYKLGTSGAKMSAENAHSKEVEQQGRYDFNPVRMLNPFIFFEKESEYINSAYQCLMALPQRSEQDEQGFLRFFDSEKCLDMELVEEVRGLEMELDEDDMNFILENWDISSKFENNLRKYCENMKARYKTENKSLINKYISFLEINNEFITPRLLKEDNLELMNQARECDICIHEGHLIYLEFQALFSMYNMLLHHPENTKEQSELQKERMYKRAEELEAVELFEDILEEKRPIKLDSTNYIHYLKEIVAVLDELRAREFINTLANDMAACMLVDSTIEPYEQEIIKI